MKLSFIVPKLHSKQVNDTYKCSAEICRDSTGTNSKLSDVKWGTEPRTVWDRKFGVDILLILPSRFAKLMVPRRNKDPASECNVKNGLVIGSVQVCQVFTSNNLSSGQRIWNFSASNSHGLLTLVRQTLTIIHNLTKTCVSQVKRWSKVSTQLARVMYIIKLLYSRSIFVIC
jgi:hypothetical protein